MAKILVAEDNKHIREGLAQALSAEGHKVEQAQNGEIALTLYESFKPNIVILDIMMPKKSGFDVCNTLRKKGENVPIIFLTAKGEETDKLLGFNLGADDYLTKPFSLRELLARIGALLRRLNLPIEPDESFTIGSHVIDPKTFTITNTGEEKLFVHISMEDMVLPEALKRFSIPSHQSSKLDPKADLTSPQ